MKKSCFLGIMVLWLVSSSVRSQEIEHGLVNLNTFSPAPLEEIRYATTYNFTGAQLYPFAAAYANKDVAAALQAVQQELKAQGLGLKIYDAYRPLSVQQKMWDLIHDERYVSDPAKSRGRHTRGTAVDVTLVDKMGNDLPMPTPFDTFSDRSHRKSVNMTKTERANMERLEAVMMKHGFVPFAFEWWHFDFKDWEKYPPLNISFEDLAKGVKTTVPVP